MLTQRLENAKRGQIDRLSEIEVLDRFQQFEQLARMLVSDFRSVEYNLRDLDKGIRQKIAMWSGSKGELLQSVLENSDGIENSQQGRSVSAFSFLLLNPNLQDEVRGMIDELYELSFVKNINYDKNVKNVYRAWITGNEHIQKTMGALSKQLRHFIDDKVFLENRRILELIRDIEKKVIEGRLLDNKDFKSECIGLLLDLPAADINLPFERPLYTVKEKIRFDTRNIEEGGNDSNVDSLFDISSVDRAALTHNIRMLLSDSDEVSLSDVIDKYPLKKGLTELLTYFSVIDDNFEVKEDPLIQDEIAWQSETDPEITRFTTITRAYIREKH